MRRLSCCIFEWDPEDLSRLNLAKQGEHSGRRNVMTIEEMSRHCRRCTRGVQETERLLDETVEVFMGATDAMNIPLLDRGRMENIWNTQRQHVDCIQDPPSVQLYTRTGQLTKGGVALPVYRCARGSTSLESFHLHLNRFIPGTAASGCFFQMYLLEGLSTWNEDWAQAAAGGAMTGKKCYSGQEQHTLNQLSQHFFGLTLVEGYTKPLEYTGELIGISYLYSQTGRTLQDFPDDPEEPDGSEELNVEKEEDLVLEEVGDEGFHEFLLDVLHPSQQPPQLPPQQQPQPPPRLTLQQPQPPPRLTPQQSQRPPPRPTLQPVSPQQQPPPVPSSQLTTASSSTVCTAHH
ncbi:uncharacterized protein LOC144462810 [Epinephelus lanceolatus]